jgi:hypothetical protein
MPDLDPGDAPRQKVSVAAARGLSPRRDQLGWYFRTVPHGSSTRCVVPAPLAENRGGTSRGHQRIDPGRVPGGGSPHLDYVRIIGKIPTN